MREHLRDSGVLDTELGLGQQGIRYNPNRRYNNPAYLLTALSLLKGDDRLKKIGFSMVVRELNNQPTLPIFLIALCVAVMVMETLLFPSTCYAGDWSDTEIVNAIYKAEGGSKAKVPYGILSVKVKDEAEARQVCFNTVRNNRKRFAKQSEYKDFIEFLGSRYCPIGCDNDNGTNKFWVKNVKYWLLKNE